MPWITVRAAAVEFGTSVRAIKQRVRRGSLAASRDETGRVLVDRDEVARAYAWKRYAAAVLAEQAREIAAHAAHGEEPDDEPDPDNFDPLNPERNP